MNFICSARQPAAWRPTCALSHPPPPPADPCHALPASRAFINTNRNQLAALVVKGWVTNCWLLGLLLFALRAIFSTQILWLTGRQILKLTWGVVKSIEAGCSKAKATHLYDQRPAAPTPFHAQQKPHWKSSTKILIIDRVQSVPFYFVYDCE